jgi:hypothetical protein
MIVLKIRSARDGLPAGVRCFDASFHAGKMIGNAPANKERQF